MEQNTLVADNTLTILKQHPHCRCCYIGRRVLSMSVDTLCTYYAFSICCFTPEFILYIAILKLLVYVALVPEDIAR